MTTAASRQSKDAANTLKSAADGAATHGAFVPFNLSFPAISRAKSDFMTLLTFVTANYKKRSVLFFVRMEKKGIARRPEFSKQDYCQQTHVLVIHACMKILTISTKAPALKTC
jgi:hypothetical protein